MMPEGLVLQDIHLPAAPGWWPPAPGWWALAVLALLLLILASRWLWRQGQRRAWRRQLADELAAIEARHPHLQSPAAHAAALSVFLRRVAVLTDAGVASRQGEAWLHFLDGDDPAHPFSEGGGRLLLEVPYRREVDPQDAERLRALVQRTLPRWAEARRV
ncbi:MAG: DUF4381 domain-containing protein [Xanthomonadaceae bacterium]|nr:DUF4381 domain-containing protein [Xanthomonadaceae bacterium]